MLAIFLAPVYILANVFTAYWLLRWMKEGLGWYAAVILLAAAYILLTIVRPGGAMFQAAMGIPF